MERAFIRSLTAIFIACLASSAWAVGEIPDARGALSSDPAIVQQTISSLRDAGPSGLAALLDLYDKSPNPQLLPAIDAVAAQHDAVYARLFWYTDLQKAEEAASAVHKPILYLRLLGKLTDEYSCANSRFFRTVLYANAGVSKFLREHYVLVWQSERPVPVMTIDYGDGRVLKRTITGNSIHYVITSAGQVIDALPGIYDPKTFVAILRDAEQLASTRALIPQAAEKYLLQKQAAIDAMWIAEAGKVAPGLVKVEAAGKAPDARMAMLRAVSKSRVEAPLVRQIVPPAVVDGIEPGSEGANEAVWQNLAALHLADARLDVSSMALIRSQNPAAYNDARVLDRTIARLQQSIALDTVHDNYQLRRRILSWLGASPGQIYVQDLNRRVYAELFLTPASDPWLGLVPENTYSGLKGDGVVVCKVKNEE